MTLARYIGSYFFTGGETNQNTLNIKHWFTIGNFMFLNYSFFKGTYDVIQSDPYFDEFLCPIHNGIIFLLV